MKKIYITLVLLLSVQIVTNAQKWTYKKSGNAFDGEYKVAMVDGSGGKFPYNSPTFFINYFQKDYSFNIFLGGVGYAGCDNNKIYVAFDKNTDIIKYDVSTNDENNTWFFDFESTKDLKQLLEMMKKNSIMNVRVKSDCLQSDYKFSLSGSNAAINFVSKDYLIAVDAIEEVEADLNRADSIEAETLMKELIRKREQEKEDSLARIKRMKNMVIVKARFDKNEVFSQVDNIPFTLLQKIPRNTELIVFPYKEKSYYEIYKIKENGNYRPVRKIGFIRITSVEVLKEYRE